MVLRHACIPTWPGIGVELCHVKLGPALEEVLAASGQVGRGLAMCACEYQVGRDASPGWSSMGGRKKQGLFPGTCTTAHLEMPYADGGLFCAKSESLEKSCLP